MVRPDNICAAQDLQAVIGLLVRWLHAPEQQDLHKAFRVCIKRVLLPAGRQEGEAAILQRPLARKFGPIDQPTRACVLAADAEQRLVWGERVLSAQTLLEVFEA